VINVAFCSNWERTETWIATGCELARRGVRVFFVMTRKEYVNKAVEAGFSRDHILWLRRDEAKRAPFSRVDYELLQSYERQTGERIRHFILMDRFMRTERPEWALHYTVYVFRKMLDFLDRHHIQLVSGQPDNIPDLLATMILKVKGGFYAAAFEFRFPTKRFVLWDSRIEERPHITGADTVETVPAHLITEARTLRDRVRSGEKMRQVLSKTQQPRLGFSYLRRLARGALYRALIVSRHDAYMYTLRSMLFDLKIHMLPINYRLNRLIWRRLFDRPVAGERFVYYTLNYAPEHTIDVEAPYFTSTEETIRNLTRMLPSGMLLYVKEHPNGLGIRGPLELLRIKRLPGVRLIDPFVDSHELIKAADMVVTLAGTASLEAALYGKQTVLLSHVFIKNFSTCQCARAPWEIGEILERGTAKRYSEEDDIKYIAWLLSNSHPGTVIEPLTDPTAIEPENISLVADGYMKVIEKLSCARTPET
jgi:hypothetical protein